MRRLFTREIILYLLVGIAGTIIDFSLFFLGTHLSLPIFAAQWLAGSVGFLHNFCWHHFKVFLHEQPLRATLIRSIIIAAAQILVSGPLVHLLEYGVHNLFFAKIILLFLMTGVAYLIRKKWIFPERSHVLMPDTKKP